MQKKNIKHEEWRVTNQTHINNPIKSYVLHKHKFLT